MLEGYIPRTPVLPSPEHSWLSASGSLCCCWPGWYWDLGDKESADKELAFSIKGQHSTEGVLFPWRTRGYLCLGNTTKTNGIHNCRSSLQPGVWIIHFPARDINPFSTTPSTTSEDVWRKGRRHFYYFYLVCGCLVFLTMAIFSPHVYDILKTFIS